LPLVLEKVPRQSGDAGIWLSMVASARNRDRCQLLVRAFDVGA